MSGTVDDIRRARLKKFAADNYDPLFLVACTLDHERNILRRTLRALLPLVGGEVLRRIVEDEISALENAK